MTQSNNNWINRIKYYESEPSEFVELDDRNLWRLDGWEDEPEMDLDELLERCSPYSPAGEVELSGDLTVFLPENYEPNYAYPLVVWMTDSQRDTRRLMDMMPKISKQNYLGITVESKIEQSSSVDASWANAATLAGPLQETLLERVRQVRSEYHVHSERIYLAGFEAGGTLAIQMLLHRPDWYGGAIAFAPEFPSNNKVLANFQQLQRKRLMIGMSAQHRSQSIAETVDAGRILYSAGMEVATRIYDSLDEAPQNMMSDLNHWLMDCIVESNLV
ncbi:MAG: hypothetical protein CMJ78_02635 [Planctomycetaceae bacterium]|nr:hypothetical protein [Planctomycetaceae bacterium]